MSEEMALPRRSQHGFTLLEVLFIMVIIAVLSAIAIPNIKSWLPNMRLKAAVTELRGTLQETRFEAIKQNAPFAVVFDPAGRTYVVCSGPGGDGDWSTTGDNTLVKTVSLDSYKSGVGYGKGEATQNASDGTTGFPASGVGFTPTANAAVFNSRGMGDSGSTGWLYLTHEDNTTVYAIGVQASGVILVRKWRGGRWQ